MGNANIPDDWEGEYVDLVVKWPMSEQWEAILRGQLSEPISDEFWDLNSGDPVSSEEAILETLDQNLHLEVGIVLPAGIIMMFAGSTLPDFAISPDGSDVSRTEFARLFAEIGTTYGAGNGTTTFTLPYVPGKVIVALDVTDADFNNLGDFGGQKEVTLEESEMPAHTHPQTSHNHTQIAHSHIQNDVVNAGGGNASFAGTGRVNGATGFTSTNPTTPTNNATTAENQNTGGGLSHNNLQPYIIFQAGITI